MGVKYRAWGCPRWRNIMHVYIHWAKDHVYWCKNYKNKERNGQTEKDS